MVRYGRWGLYIWQNVTTVSTSQFSLWGRLLFISSLTSSRPSAAGSVLTTAGIINQYICVDRQCAQVSLLNNNQQVAIITRYA